MQKSSIFLNMRFVSHKTHCHKMDSILDSKLNMIFINIRETRKFERDSWKIDVPTTFNRVVVVRIAHKVIGIFFLNTERQKPTIYINKVSNLLINNCIWIIGNKAFLEFISKFWNRDNDSISSLYFEWRLHEGGSNFWAFGIKHDGKICFSILVEFCDDVDFV